MDNKYELILTILNRGFSDLVMDSARAVGATGGTIVTARGTGTKEVERLFGITVSQEKELVLILTLKENRNAIMNAICKSVGLNTQGKGITFSLPVDDIFGVSFGIKGETVEENAENEQTAQTNENVAETEKTEEMPAETEVKAEKEPSEKENND